MRFAGQASPERQGMWANFDFVNLVQYNDGFKTGPIGTAEQVADRTIELKKIGVDLYKTSLLSSKDSTDRLPKC